MRITIAQDQSILLRLKPNDTSGLRTAYLGLGSTTRCLGNLSPNPGTRQGARSMSRELPQGLTLQGLVDLIGSPGAAQASALDAEPLKVYPYRC
jgi:hypothetical protein